MHTMWCADTPIHLPSKLDSESCCNLACLLASYPRTPIHIAAVSDSNPASPFGRWYLDYMEQETFTKPGLYIVRLAATRQEAQRPGSPATQRLEQVAFITIMFDCWPVLGSFATAWPQYKPCMRHDSL
jgi:hypothetical protein